MMDQVNLSRLSHGVRAAAMMRRCWNEARSAATGREVFGTTVAAQPLARRQLAKIRLPAEQALSMAMFTAHVMEAEQSGKDGASEMLRLLTPLIKLRACRDNISVATGSMEMRGGNGYIEDWANARLVRDAQVGLLWEGTSNIVALDAITRAVARVGAHCALHEHLSDDMGRSGVETGIREQIGLALDRAGALAERVAGNPSLEQYARQAARGLYDASSAAVMASEGARMASAGDADRRTRWAQAVLRHRLSVTDPLAIADDANNDDPAWLDD